MLPRETRTIRPALRKNSRRRCFCRSLWVQAVLIFSVFVSTFMPLYFYQIFAQDQLLAKSSFSETRNGTRSTVATKHTNSRSENVGDTRGADVEGTTTKNSAARSIIISKNTTAIRSVTSPFAYVFLIGGIHENRPAYKGFLFSVLIASQILHKKGSTADVWLMVQFSPDSELTDVLPDEDARLLDGLDIHVRVLPKPVTAESFSEIVYEKFRILQMIDYQRVMFLDADIIPVANLDYLFQLSLNGTLRPNLIVATRGEPCNAGLFILEPTATAWDELEQVILDQHESAKDLPYPKFDRVRGWGHSFIDAGDEWTGIVKTGRRWNYHASHSDQGLLYYWAKYLKQNVSIVIGDRIENWVSHDIWRGNTGGAPGDDTDESLPVKLSTLNQDDLVKFTSKEPLAYQSSCDRKPGNSFLCNVPYRDYVHFSGRKKPWQKDVKALQWHWSERVDNVNKMTSDLNAPTKLWFQVLHELNEQLRMNIDNEFWATLNMTGSPLGYMAMFRDHYNRVEQFHNVTAAASKE